MGPTLYRAILKATHRLVDTRKQVVFTEPVSARLWGHGAQHPPRHWLRALPNY